MQSESLSTTHVEAHAKLPQLLLTLPALVAKALWHACWFKHKILLKPAGTLHLCVPRLAIDPRLHANFRPAIDGADFHVVPLVSMHGTHVLQSILQARSPEEAIQCLKEAEVLVKELRNGA